MKNNYIIKILKEDLEYAKKYLERNRKKRNKEGTEYWKRYCIEIEKAIINEEKNAL